METESNKLGSTLVAGLISAIIGATIWAMIIILFRYEVAILAWGLGGLSGYAVGYIAKKQVNGIHQFFSVISALLGIIIGKYAAFAYQVNGRTIGSIFDSEAISIFQKNLSLAFDGFDIIFILLAVITAWQVPLRFKHSEENKDEIHQHINEQNETAVETNEAEEKSHM